MKLREGHAGRYARCAVVCNRGQAALVVRLAVGGGVAWGLQFGRQGFVFAPWLALAPLLLLTGHPRAGRLAFVHGLVSWLVAQFR